MKKLKNYQEEAIEQLLTYSNMYFKLDGKETIVFQSPTGSGKTFTMARFMLELVNSNDRDLCFLWISIGKGDLHVQSMKSVKRETDDTLTCTLVENEFFGSRSVINQNEVVFINWEKIRNKDKKTGEFKNTIMKNNEQINFPEVIKETHNLGREIVLIIDESHAGATTGRAKEIRDEIIEPDLTIEMSATPVLTNDMQARVVVDPIKVIQEGMIKKEIIINQGIEKIVDDEMDSEKLVLESAFQKRKELALKYKSQNSIVNPLVLIQLPNSSNGENKKESVIKFLKDKDITEDNGKLAVWLSDEKINNESEKLLANNGNVQFLIFKQAIDTGWDCPRAQILIKFREINSITFEIQTVGRILRMPEAKHYSDETLNKSYVYSNIKSIDIKKEVYNPNIIKSLVAKRSDKYTPTLLRSYYRNRVDFGDINISFYKVFEHEFCKFFRIQQFSGSETIDFYKNMELLRTKGVVMDYKNNDFIINDVTINSENVDKDIKVNIYDSLIKVGISLSDLEEKYETIIRNNLNGFAPKRSIPTVKQAILYAFKKYLGLESVRGGIMYIQNIIVFNSELFNELLDFSTKAYIPVHQLEVNEKCAEEFNNNWEIESSKHYNPTTNEKIVSKLSLYQPLYMEIKSGRVDQLEIDFIEYLDKFEDKIEWFWKNGSEHMKTNFGIQKEDKSTFQPDFIIKFKDGRIGIFDTKAAKGPYEGDNKIKSNALYKYVSEERFKGNNIIGGIVIKDKNVFKYYQHPTYKRYDEAPELWDTFDKLFK